MGKGDVSMERLTTRSVLGGWTLKVPRQEAVDRLAAYEDTGLEPEEINYLKNTGFELMCIDGYPERCTGDCSIACSGYQWHLNGTPVKRLEEVAALVKAREEGRVAVLPYHRGDRIYVVDSKVRNSIRVTRLESYLIYTEDPVRVLIKCTANSSWHDLENVYSTRDEAEAALSGGGGDG